MDLLRKLKPTATSKYVQYAMFERPKQLGMRAFLSVSLTELASGGSNRDYKY